MKGQSVQRRMTRRQAQAWLLPIRTAFKEMKAGYVDSIRGYPVTRLDEYDLWERIDHCLAGFRCLCSRLFPGLDVSALVRVEKKLDAGLPLTVEELNACLTTFHYCEDLLVGMDIRVVKDAVVTEQVAIEIEKLGLNEVAHASHC